LATGGGAGEGGDPELQESGSLGVVALERLARTVVQENNSHTCPPLRNSRNIMIM